MFFRKTVDGILANLQKTVDQLNEVAKDSREDAVEFQARANYLILKSSEAHKEADRASRVADKVAKLLA